MPKPAHQGPCRFEPAKRGTHEVCGRPGCKERFPCAGNDCGHLDCAEARGVPPNCHFCCKPVGGLRGDSWGIGLVRGLERAYHYECRDSH